jgi:hypothetical protein
MKRVQVQLTEEQVEALRKLAESTGVGMAATVRSAVDDWIAKHERDAKWERALAVSGRFHSGLGDLAENHDFYLGEDKW